MALIDTPLNPPDAPEEESAIPQPSQPDTEPLAEGVEEVTCSDSAENSSTEQPEVTPEHTPDGIARQLEGIATSLQELRGEFASKLRYDEGRQIVIDRQYEELERFRKEEAEKHSRAIVHDLISEIDSVEKNAAFYQGMEPTPENFSKLLRLFNSFSEDLRDLLENNDIITYRSEAGSPFNAKRQRVLKTIPTADAVLDRSVAQSLRWGFETTEGRLIRHELVAVYVCKPAPSQTAETPAS